MRGLQILQPLRERDFALYFAGTSVSLLGDGIFLVAIAWQVYDLWNVPAALAIVGVAETVPLVALVLVGGVIADRVERRRVLFFASVLRGAAVAVLGTLAVTGTLELWQIFVISVIYGTGQAFSAPAAGAIVPDLVAAHHLVQANAITQFVRPLAMRFLGPAIGGLIVHQLGAGTAFLTDAATFAFASGMLLAMSPRAPAGAGEAGASFRADIREGLAFVRRHVWLWGILAWWFFALLLIYGPFQVLVPYIVKNDLGGDAGDLGLIFAAAGVGTMAGAIVLGQTGLPRRYITFMFAAWGVEMVAIAVYAAAAEPWHAMVIALVSEGLGAGGSIVWATLLQRLVPGELLGRVKSIDWFLSIGLAPLSLALTAPAAAWLGAETVMVAAGIGAGVLTVSCYFLPGMRETERDGRTTGLILARERVETV
jgi:hypothetical protein